MFVVYASFTHPPNTTYAPNLPTHRSKENSETRVVARWALLKIALDCLQLLTTIVQPAAQGWNIDPSGRRSEARGYGAYLAVLYSTVAALGLNLALCVWVAWCFKEQKFPAVWPIK
ncbi:hypothetical protein TSOC_009961, partial [Tetrabaena socialis]